MFRAARIDVRTGRFYGRFLILLTSANAAILALYALCVITFTCHVRPTVKPLLYDLLLKPHTIYSSASSTAPKHL